MLHVHSIDELEKTEPLVSPETEADQLQADIIKWLTDVAVSGFSLDPKQKQKVEFAVASLWMQQQGGAQGFAEQFRMRCCNGPRLKPELYQALQTLSNGSRINAVLFHLGLENLATFFVTHIDDLKISLLEQGIDVDCVEGSRRIVG